MQEQRERAVSLRVANFAWFITRAVADVQNRAPPELEMRNSSSPIINEMSAFLSIKRYDVAFIYSFHFH